MNKNKVSKFLKSKVCAMQVNQKQEVFVVANDFSSLNQFLKENKFQFSPYRFANSVIANVDACDISILSNQEFVNFILPNNPVALQRYETDFMNISALTENKYFGQNQTICFIDTGLDAHFDFLFPKSKIVKFVDLVNHNETPYDDNGHGTIVAGIACGSGIVDSNFKGFAPESKIISIKALSSAGNGSSNTILDAMEWVFQHHKAYNISVVCMSFGADAEIDLDPLSKGAEALWKRGIIVVAAAGNSGPEKRTIKSPGNNPHIITVGGIDLKDMSVPSFSSRGPTFYGHKPDLLAPAVDVPACSVKNFPYKTMSGTSIATPIVAGICAIIKSKYPRMNNNQVKQFLLAHCKPIINDRDTEGAGFLQF